MLLRFNKLLINKMETNNLKSKKKVEINKMKLISKYEKLRNDYFLRKVFYNLDKKKSLKIVKYNKKIQGYKEG